MNPVRVLELRSVRGTGGGPEKTILLGAAIANRAACEVTVCYLRDIRDNVFAVDQRAAAIGCDYVEILERHSFDWSVVPRLRTLVNERGIDIVHGHDYKTNWLAWLTSKRTKALPISTAHGYTGQTFRETRVYYPTDKRLLRFFPRVIAVSSDLKADLVRHGVRAERVQVLVNGIDPGKFRRVHERRPEVREAIGVRADHILIGAVGRVEHQKRFDLLLEVIAALPPRIALAVVGDGSLRSDLEAKAAALKIADRCHWLGHRDDVADLHNAFDVLVQTSDYEGTPNAVLEAMALETPVVATAAGGTTDIIESGREGLVVPPGDVASIRAAVKAVLDDPVAARQRARAARRRVETELSFEGRTRRLENIYLELIERSRRGSASMPAPVAGVSSDVRRA